MSNERLREIETFARGWRKALSSGRGETRYVELSMAISMIEELVATLRNTEGDTA